MTKTDKPQTQPDGQQTGSGSNSAKTMADLKKDIRKFGSSEALGSAMRPIAAKTLVEAAYDGLAKEGDAEELYAEYQAGMTAVGRKNPLTVGDASEKVQISKFRQFIKVGMLPGVDARELMRRTSDAINAHKTAGAKINIPFDCLLNAARKQIASPDTDLTDAEIDACVLKAEAAKKEEIDKLIDLYKKSVKLEETLKAPSLHSATLALKDAITEAGGEVPPMTKEEKEKAAFLAQAAKFGMSFATPIAAE